MEPKLVNLDKENLVIYINHKGLEHALTRQDIVRLLDYSKYASEDSRAISALNRASSKGSFSLVAVGKVVGAVFRKGESKATSLKLLNMMDYLDGFDGHIERKKQTSQLYHMVNEIKDWNLKEIFNNNLELVNNFQTIVNTFLADYQVMKDIPKKVL